MRRVEPVASTDVQYPPEGGVGSDYERVSQASQMLLKQNLMCVPILLVHSSSDVYRKFAKGGKRGGGGGGGGGGSIA